MTVTCSLADILLLRNTRNISELTERVFVLFSLVSLIIGVNKIIEPISCVLSTKRHNNFLLRTKSKQYAGNLKL